MSEFLCDTCWAVFSDGASELCPGADGEPGCGADRGKGWRRLPCEIAPGLTATRALGRGGFAAVFLCKGDGGKSTLAVKVSRRDGPRNEANKPKKVEAFEYEIRIATRVSEAPVFVSVHSSAFRPEPYLAMEPLEGWGSLERLVHPKGEGAGSVALPLDEALDLGVALLAGVELIHRSGIVHRDLHPGNLFVRRASAERPLELKVIDFGLGADVNAATVLAAPRIGAAGRPLYASPDQLAGAPPARADDIYTVAVVLWELIAGARPSSPEAARPEAMPEPIWAALKHALTTRREGRPTAAELLARFEPLQKEHAARRLTRLAQALVERVRPLSQSLAELERLGHGVENAQRDPASYRRELEQRRGEVQQRLARAHRDLNGAVDALPLPARRSWTRLVAVACGGAALGLVVGVLAGSGGPERGASDQALAAAPPPAPSETVEAVSAAPDVVVAPPRSRVELAGAALTQLFEGGELSELEEGTRLRVRGTEMATGATAVAAWRDDQVFGRFRDTKVRVTRYFDMADVVVAEVVFSGVYHRKLVAANDLASGGKDVPRVLSPDAPEPPKGVSGDVRTQGAVLFEMDQGGAILAIDIYLNDGPALAQLGFMKPGEIVWERPSLPLFDPAVIGPEKREVAEHNASVVRRFYEKISSGPSCASVAAQAAPGFRFDHSGVSGDERVGLPAYLATACPEGKPTGNWWLRSVRGAGGGYVITTENGNMSGARGDELVGYSQLGIWQLVDGVVHARHVYTTYFAYTRLPLEKAGWFGLFGQPKEPKHAPTR